MSETNRVLHEELHKSGVKLTKDIPLLTEETTEDDLAEALEEILDDHFRQ